MAAPVGDRDEGPILDQKDSAPGFPDQIKRDRLCAPPPRPGKKNNQEKQRGGKSGREGNGKEIYTVHEIYIVTELWRVARML